MDNKIHDLDEGVVEYFEFKLFGNLYRFKQMNTEEVAKMREFGEDADRVQEYLYTFISPVDEKTPSFLDVSKKMTIPHLQKFQKMIRQEFGIDSEVK
jgi:hypothetical protein